MAQIVELIVTDDRRGLSKEDDPIRCVEQLWTKDGRDIALTFEELYPGREFTDTFNLVSIKRFLKRLPKAEVMESLLIASARFPRDSRQALKYFCGVCWSKIRESAE